MGFLSGIPILELVDAVSGKATLEGNQLSEQLAVPILMKDRKSRIGILASGGFGFESNFMERGSMNLGIIYSNIHYKFDPGISSHNITEPELLNPDGSGIDFIVAYYFIF